MSHPPPLPPGTELCGCILGKVIGRGGMGTVYEARQQLLDRPVAVKVLHPGRLRDPAQLEAFRREVQAAAALVHPHLVAVHQVEIDAAQERAAYSMELVAGQTLTALVTRLGPLSRNQALHITYQAAKALGHAHRKGLVHRDVKPDNILVDDALAAKVLDLGLARDLLANHPLASAHRLALVGTPAWSAPEQLRDPDRAEPASDVWSLGATLFFLLVGRPPFAGTSVIDLIIRIASEPLDLPDSLPNDCRLLLGLMLAKDPEGRLPDGDAVAKALDQLAAGCMPSLPADPAKAQTAALAAGTGRIAPRRRAHRRLRRIL
jgi:serine/threonine-protein kinase